MLIFRLIILFFLIQNVQIFSNENYESNLEKTYHAFLNKDLKRASEKLQIIDKNFAEKDWRYFSIKGEIEDELNQTDEAIKSFTISITLNQTNAEIFKRIYELYTKLKKPFKAFDYLRLYLSQNPTDEKLRYKALLLAKRLGETEYYDFAIKKLPTTKSKKEDLILEIKNLLEMKKWNEAEIKIDDNLLYFPEDESIHQYRKILFTKTQNYFKLEESLLEAAILFSEKPKYILELANFYKKSKKFHKALNLYRRYFYLSLKTKNYKESFLFMSEIYFSMNRIDSKAFLELEKIKDEENIFELLKVLSITYPNCREIHIFAIRNAIEKNNLEVEKYFKEKLTLRDLKKADEELLNVYSLFLKED